MSFGLPPLLLSGRSMHSCGLVSLGRRGKSGLDGLRSVMSSIGMAGESRTAVNRMVWSSNGAFSHDEHCLGKAGEACQDTSGQGGACLVAARIGEAGMALRVRARRGADCRGMAGKASLVGLWSDPVRQGAECPPKIWHGRVGQGRQGGSCRGQSRCVTVRFVGTRYGKAGMVSNKTNRITTRKEYL